MYEHLNTATAFLSPHSTTATILETLLCMRFLFILVLSHKNLSIHFYKQAFKQLCIDVHRCQNWGTLLLSLGPPLWSRSLRHRVGKLYRFNKNCCAGDGEDGVMASLPAGAARNIIGIFMENVFTAGGCITARHQH